MTCEIPLGKSGLVALVDDADYHLVSAFVWHAHHSRTGVYARLALGPLMHTVLTGWPLVDHRNGDGLDNRRSNLRQADSSQNAQNRRGHAIATSQFKGVHWNRQRRKWIAEIGYRGVRTRLGAFVDEVAAARAYDAAAERLFGEYARLNFPETTP